MSTTNEKKRCSGTGMGYCPFLVQSHDTADCIVTQQGWARARGHDTAEQGCVTRRCYTAGLRAGASGNERTQPSHRGVSRYNFCIVIGGLLHGASAHVRTATRHERHCNTARQCCDTTLCAWPGRSIRAALVPWCAHCALDLVLT